MPHIWIIMNILVLDDNHNTHIGGNESIYTACQFGHSNILKFLVNKHVIKCTTDQGKRLRGMAIVMRDDKDEAIAARKWWQRAQCQQEQHRRWRINLILTMIIIIDVLNSQDGYIMRWWLTSNRTTQIPNHIYDDNKW